MIVRETGGRALPKEITDQIIDRTDGVPLFIEELTKSVVESGLVTEAGDRYTAAGPLPPLAIPATLNASLLARIDRLALVRELAQIAAALGRLAEPTRLTLTGLPPRRHVYSAILRRLGCAGDPSAPLQPPSPSVADGHHRARRLAQDGTNSKTVSLRAELARRAPKREAWIRYFGHKPRIDLR
jgi:hypothetical protein